MADSGHGSKLPRSSLQWKPLGPLCPRILACVVLGTHAGITRASVGSLRKEVTAAVSPWGSGSAGEVPGAHGRVSPSPAMTA